MRTSYYSERYLFFLTDIRKDPPVIVRMPQFTRYNLRINFTTPYVLFDSTYYRTYYSISHSANLVAPLYPSLPYVLNDLPIPSELLLLPAQLRSAPSLQEPRPLPYAPPRPTIEYEPKPNTTQAAFYDSPTLPLKFNLLLTTNPYQTAWTSSLIEARALLIPQPISKIPRPTQKRGGCLYLDLKRLTPLRPLPPLYPNLNHLRRTLLTLSSLGLIDSLRVNLLDIQCQAALNFARFYQGDGVRAIVVTQDDLNHAKRLSLQLLKLIKQEFYAILTRTTTPANIAYRFNPTFFKFLINYYYSAQLYKVSIKDINIFLYSKLELSPKDIRKRLPPQLTNLSIAFLLASTHKLPPHRPQDYHIKLVLGREPSYSKARPLSLAKLKVVRKWLDDNLEKGYICESQARYASLLILAIKLGGSVQICQDY